jgi:sigma-54 dependent transcriptional regulator, acetoin dehydrogenase operon transcriptional activator AcoR
MSTDSALVTASPVRGSQAWRRTLEIRERYLAAGDPDWLPPQDCGVRREIVLSWRRSLLSGVDTSSTDLPRDEDATPPSRLVQAARPVLDRLAGEISGTQSWAFLADRECRLVDHVVGQPALMPLLEERGAFPGARFGEDVVGTNGLGTAVEQQRPFIVVGSEHFRAYESDATTAGAPVRDPVTRRLIGLLNMNCHYERTSELMLPFVAELAREIEVRLTASLPVAEQALLAEVTRMWKRRSQAVVVLAEDVFVANAAAVTMLGGAEHELLRDLARDTSSLGRELTANLQLGPDLLVTARCQPVGGTSRHPAAVVTLTASASPATGGSAPRTSPWKRLRGQLGDARAGRLPVLLVGERGSGKTTLASRVPDPAGATQPCTVVDCALASASPPAWAQRLSATLADPAATVILQHLDALDPQLVALTAGLMASSRAWLAATAASHARERSDLTPLVERFPVVVDVPPLRDRAADIPGLVTEIISQLRPQPPHPRCTPEALAVLAASDWPGNIRQLRQVIATALTRSMSCDITIDDLPTGYRGAARSRLLTGLERAERQALLTALRDAGWDREAAARDLGISRATIYRKLKRLGIAPSPDHPTAQLRQPAQEGA